MNPNLPPMHRLRVRALPDDMVRKVLDQLVEGTPPEDLCGRLYERCLLLLGSGQCPPDHPIWAQACRRFGVMQKGEGLGTWQATFRTFCTEVAGLPPNIRATLWKYVRGDGAAVPYEEFVGFLRYFIPPSYRERRGGFPVVSRALDHFGVRDPETAEFLNAWYAGAGAFGDEGEAMLQLIDGHPRQGALAIVRAIRSPGNPDAQRLIPALLDAGVPTETLVRDRETLLHYAVREKNPYAVAQLLLVGADQTVRNAEGVTAAEMAMKLVVDTLDSDEGAWRMRLGDHGWVVITAPEEILQLLWPEAAAQWLAMSEAERRATAARS